MRVTMAEVREIGNERTRDPDSSFRATPKQSCQTTAPDIAMPQLLPGTIELVSVESPSQLRGEDIDRLEPGLKATGSRSKAGQGEWGKLPMTISVVEVAATNWKASCSSATASPGPDSKTWTTGSRRSIGVLTGRKARHPPGLCRVPVRLRTPAIYFSNEMTPRMITR